MTEFATVTINHVKYWYCLCVLCVCVCVCVHACVYIYVCASACYWPWVPIYHRIHKAIQRPPRPPVGFHLGRPTLSYRATALQAEGAWKVSSAASQLEALHAQAEGAWKVRKLTQYANKCLHTRSGNFHPWFFLMVLIECESTGRGGGVGLDSIIGRLRDWLSKSLSVHALTAENQDRHCMFFTPANLNQ